MWRFLVYCWSCWIVFERIVVIHQCAWYYNGKILPDTCITLTAEIAIADTSFMNIQESRQNTVHYKNFVSAINYAPSKSICYAFWNKKQSILHLCLLNTEISKWTKIRYSKLFHVWFDKPISGMSSLMIIFS